MKLPDFLNTFLTKSMYLRFSLCTSKFGLPLSANCLVNRNVLTYAHRSRWSIGHERPPPPLSPLPPAIALCSGLLLSFQTSYSPAVSALLQCLASKCCEAGLSSSSPAGSRQGLACGAGCWLPEGVSDPAPLPPQYLLGHWFLSRSLPQIFISDLLLPLDFVDAPQTGVEECQGLSLHRLCCPPCLTSVKQD